jgi:hypothetical protein
MPRDRSRSRTAITLPTLAILLACLVAACNSQSFQQSSGPSMPTPPPAPVQPPPPPFNPATQIDGNWFARYTGGPLRVVIGLDQMKMGRNYVATLVDHNKDYPAGQVMWRGTVDPNAPNIVLADQVCAQRGFIAERTVKARLIVADLDHMTEQLVDPKSCAGFPVKYTRASASDAPKGKN